MSVVLAVVVGLLAVRLLVGAGHELLRAEAFERPNRHGRRVPTAMGLFAVLAVLLVEAGRSAFAAFGVGDAPASTARVLVLFTCFGFGLLGLLDDVVGSQSDAGFRGHLAALARGRVTTGLVKIAGGGALAIVLVSVNRPHHSGPRLVADAAIVALFANLTNLFDTAPGRTIKVALLAWVPIALVARGDAVGVAVAPVVGAFAGLLGDDLRERLMLGDTGSNVIGAVLGLAVVLECGAWTRAIVLAALVALTFASELVSFGRVIERVPALRRFDELGRGA